MEACSQRIMTANHLLNGCHKTARLERGILHMKQFVFDIGAALRGKLAVEQHARLHGRKPHHCFHIGEINRTLKGFQLRKRKVSSGEVRRDRYPLCTVQDSREQRLNAFLKGRQQRFSIGAADLWRDRPTDMELFVNNPCVAFQQRITHEMG